MSRFNSKILAVAPMVAHSGEAYRVLSRKYGANMVFTEMINSKVFLTSKYKHFIINDCENLRVQICGNDPQLMLKTGKYLEQFGEGIDINFGCPQNIARKGNYGAFLQKDWILTEEITRTLSSNLEKELSCKIRIFEDPQVTLKYVKMLEQAGVKLLTVHGRTITQKKEKTGLADWNQIKLIKESLRIPVIANGNIAYHSDIEKCLLRTGADGVMVAETHLYNPLIFSKEKKNAFEILYEYITLTRSIKTDWAEIKNHAFKILYHIFQIYPQYRNLLQECRSTDELLKLIDDLYLFCKSNNNCPLFYEMKPKLRGKYIDC